MTTLEEIERESQLIVRCEKSIALEKVRKRKADTRRKIELGGLVIKSGMYRFNMTIILGALIHSVDVINESEIIKKFFEVKACNFLRR